ncbi:3-hydroxyacyl-CoA dehydrogenase [Aliidongia dinghuensis]|uniref:3-hydroxyacyl-CoA dehydrogenase n=1 Tax=Aliidongia dinghuensis TaxID=1867774 RepID=A0A8J2YPZ7_9PROT|nr:3-hydroxyacyl-CoA dehydrogenase NAD-binding domain-containing protein [Aliidongia dinghuensis]GGF02383.1 3-hydroxyacyl-CoA dehydrogenase [Aliidongia dinghuensis]
MTSPVTPSPVTSRRSGDIAVVIIDNPPVNALGHKVRAGLATELAALEADATVAAVVLACAGRTFVAGADITEFGKPLEPPGLHEVIAQIGRMTKPVVAAIHGTALGGGLELALGCHYRVAVATAQFGLPEVKLGILPGAGGTQRLPRVLGVIPALEIMTTGDFIGADKALAGGLIQRILPDLDQAAVDFAREIAAARPLPLIEASDGKLAEARANPGLIDEFARSIARRSRGFRAPGAIIDCVKAALAKPFADGLAYERERFMELVQSPESAAQRYAFFAEREAGKVPGLPSDTPVRPIRRAAVIGAGTMGGGIAMNFANAGIPVTLIETGAEALERGLKTIRANYEATAKRGGITPADAEARFARITGSLKLEDAAEADIVTEAVFEEMGLKKDLFGKLDRIVRADAILATNTSTLDVNEIAAATSRPERVLGTHYFSPANVMKLLEIVRGTATAPDVLATAMAMARKLKKVPVVVGVCYGFVGNRMLHRRASQVESLLLEGASPAELDQALLDFGFPMGPCAMADLAGIDVGWRIRQGLGIRDEVSDRLYEAGRLGQKTGAGFFRYEPGNRAPIPDPAVDAIIAAAAAAKGIDRRSIPQDEILARLLYPMVNEAAHILEEGIASRASDIDIVWFYGYGWPVYRGGPMYWADHIGLETIRAGLQKMTDRLSDARLKPAPLLARLAAEGRGFLGPKA